MALAFAVLSPVGCTYDYGALGGRPEVGVGQTGGASAGSGGRAGTGGIAGAAAASGGRPGDVVVGGSGGAATGGTGTGGRGAGGAGGAEPFSIPGGTGGGSTGVATGGAGGGGGRGGTGLGGAAVAAIISIDFVGGMPMAAANGGAGGNGGTGAAQVLVAAPTMTPTEVAGVKPAARWNAAPGAAGTVTNLLHADGTISSASVTWKAAPAENAPGVWKNKFPDAPGNSRMMNGYLDPPSNALPATVVVSNLPAEIATAGYDVYVYVVGDVPSGTRTYTYSVGATTATMMQTGPTPGTFSGFVLAPAGGTGNYIVFRNVTGTTFTLTAQPPVGSVTRAPVNGMQIVSPPGP